VAFKTDQSFLKRMSISRASSFNSEDDLRIDRKVKVTEEIGKETLETR